MAMPIFDFDPAYDVLAELPLETPLLQDENERLKAALVDLRDELVPKLLTLAKVVRTLESEADLLEEHARALNGRAGTRRRRAEYLKSWMQLQMEGAEVDRLRDPFLTVWLQKSPPSVEVLDEMAVPPEFKRAVLRLPYSRIPADLRGFMHHLDIERTAILDLAKRTGEIPAGVRIRTGARHLRIR